MRLRMIAGMALLAAIGLFCASALLPEAARANVCAQTDELCLEGSGALRGSSIFKVTSTGTVHANGGFVSDGISEFNGTANVFDSSVTIGGALITSPQTNYGLNTNSSIRADAGYVLVSASASITLAKMNISSGTYAGQHLIVKSTGAAVITLTDQGNLAGSNVILSGGSVTLAVSSATPTGFIWSTDTNDWYQVR